MDKEKLGGFCPFLGMDCLQTKCEFAYCVKGEFKWCSIKDMCINVDIVNTNLKAVVHELEIMNKGR